MSRKCLKFRILFFIIFLQLGLIFGYTCPNAENSYRIDSQEFSTLDVQTFDPKDFNPQGLNFQPDRSQSERGFFQESEEWNNQTTRSSKKSSGSRRSMRDNVKMILRSYQSDFDRGYSRGSNYSEIFQAPLKQRVVNYLKTRKSTNYRYSSFPSLLEIYEYLEVLEKLGKGRAIIFPLKYHNGSWHIAHTNFGNEILSIRISELAFREENPIIVVVAGIHGRDWYAIQSAIFLATELILNDNRTSRQDLDWWIVPVLNPDGYEISQIDARWGNREINLRETRDVESNECFGLDLDLNFEYQWLACNNTPCDLNFPEDVPFSALESRALRDTLSAFSDYCDSFVALKEGRQMLVYPFSDTLESPRHVDCFENLSIRAVEAFSQHVQGYYDYGQSSYLINIRAGFIEDWAKVHLGIDKSFAFYLGPKKKDRRDLKSQHLMDHMNGTLDLLNVIAHGKIGKKTENSSSRMFLSLIYIVINFIVVR